MKMYGIYFFFIISIAFSVSLVSSADRISLSVGYLK